MKIEKLNNNIHQVIDGDKVMIQGTYNDCLGYMADVFLNKIKTTPELLNVFKRLNDK
jgi:hypothetical protein